MVRRLYALGALVAVVFGVFIVSNPALADDDHNQGQMIAPGLPPPVPYDVASAPPGGGYVWVAGHWFYRPTGWIWAPGYWELAPYPGAVWVPGRWVYRPYGWVWVPGHWQGYVAVISSPPPPPRVEVLVAPPFVGAVWIGGSWRWEHGWIWVPGRWAPAPWRGAVWAPGHWARRPGGWVWISGNWR